jgi:hypothetical protein
MIGDSSLGNAIDSQEFSRLSSKSTVNCALTGLYGYEGPYNLLKTARKYHPEIKNVIMMNTLDMQTRDVTYAGYARTAYSLGDFLELTSGEKIMFIDEFYHYLKSISLKQSVEENLIRYDYVRQSESLGLLSDIKALEVDKLNQNKNRFLFRIVNNLNLIYVNGPIYEEEAQISRDYIEAANNQILKTGINLIPEIIEIKGDDLGDSLDHVRPEMKKEYTLKYYELIKSYLE